MQGILIFYYLGGAGGKFIANCLTYSGQVAFSNYSIALRNNPEEYNSELLKTIPDKSNSRSWMALEHGCAQLFGTGTSYIKQQGQVHAAVEFNDLTILKDHFGQILHVKFHIYGFLKFQELFSSLEALVRFFFLFKRKMYHSFAHMMKETTRLSILLSFPYHLPDV